MRLRDRIIGWLRHRPWSNHKTVPLGRGQVDHIIILDGTMSSLIPGQETNAGRTYRLLCESVPAARRSIVYEKGVQWRRWRDILDVVEGRGINRQIRRAYGFIASRYRPGDRIFLLGYSRGAFAVRSLAGVIDRIGLLTADSATERNVSQAYRYYQQNADSEVAKVFARTHCHPETDIEMVGVWDTVKALGIGLPMVSRLSNVDHSFHNHSLGHSIKHGYHALAMDERRSAYEPVLWESRPAWEGELEQMWFRGAHGDIGGQLGGYEAARPLANIPLIWMLEKIERRGIALPENWRDRFYADENAPSVGTLRGWSLIFVRRKNRVFGVDPSERNHPSVLGVRKPSNEALANRLGPVS